MKKKLVSFLLILILPPMAFADFATTAFDITAIKPAGTENSFWYYVYLINRYENSAQDISQNGQNIVSGNQVIINLDDIPNKQSSEEDYVTLFDIIYESNNGVKPCSVSIAVSDFSNAEKTISIPVHYKYEKKYYDENWIWIEGSTGQDYGCDDDSPESEDLTGSSEYREQEMEIAGTCSKDFVRCIVSVYAQWDTNQNWYEKYLDDDEKEKLPGTVLVNPIKVMFTQEGE